MLAGAVFYAVCGIWPFFAIFLTHGAARIVYVVIVALIVLVFADCTRFHKAKAWYVFGYPITTALFIYILVRTMLLNLIQGGMYWRGTFYSLKELKANRV